jgi:outer membrane protein TolC
MSADHEPRHKRTRTLPGREHRSRLSAAQIDTVTATLTIEQARAALRELTARKPRLAKTVIDLGIEQHPADPPPHPRMIP